MGVGTCVYTTVSVDIYLDIVIPLKFYNQPITNLKLNYNYLYLHKPILLLFVPPNKLNYQPMREITDSDFRRYLRDHNEVIFHDRIGSRKIKIPIVAPKKIKRYAPKSFTLEHTNVWSFPLTLFH